MKILLEGQYKYNLFKEFNDEYGKLKNVGQDLLNEIMATFQNVPEGEFPDAFFQKLKWHNEENTFRFAFVDYLYWYEFQNKCSQFMRGYIQYLKTDDYSMFVQNLQKFDIVITSLFDSLNCEKCTNISYFALQDDIVEVMVSLLSKKVIGLETTFTLIVDLIDSLMSLSSAQKCHFKYGNVDFSQIIIGIIEPHLKNFVSMSQKISKIKSSEIENQIVQDLTLKFKSKDFVSLQGLNYDYQKTFIFKSTLLQLFMNPGLSNKDHKPEVFEKILPPQHTLEVFIDIFNNPFIHKEAKNSILTVMCKIIQLDIIPRFRMGTALKNPYFQEAVKYHQTYVDLVQKLVKYHLTEKVNEKDQIMHMEDQDYLKSQSFLSDFLLFLENIAKCKIRSINSQIFPQIMNEIVQLITVKYDSVKDAYPVNFSCQVSAIKLLKNAIRSQSSFDDTQSIEHLIQKIKHELEIIKKQSEHSSKDPKGYLKIFENSWPGDDDYLAKHQTLSQRQILLKQLMSFISYCIQRNDQNLQSYNQNFVPHSRKILESSLIQDDLLINIFKIHETLPNQQDPEVKAQIEETVSPLVFISIQLVTQVFNDLPAKIQTFISNGVFAGVVNSLVNGGIPVNIDMSHTFVQFMQMLTLNSDSLQLLRDSQLFKKFYQLCLQPEKYFRYIRNRVRRDEFDGLDHLVQTLANQDTVLCQQVLDVIIEVSHEILPRSHELTKQYIEMDHKLREFDNKHSANMTPELESEKNIIKSKYEIIQQNFENFFCGYYQRVALLVDPDGPDVSNTMLDQIQERKQQILQILYEGIRNPVVASALHQHSNPYLTVVIYILNSLERQDPRDMRFDDSQFKDQKELVTHMIGWLKKQVGNMQKLLQGDFQNKPDVKPVYCKDLEMYELQPIHGQDQQVKDFQSLMNGDSKLSAEDQTAIVLRKIFLYLEYFTIYIKIEPIIQNYDKIKQVLHDSPDGVCNSLINLMELSTLITKNRGINYDKSMRAEYQKLQEYVQTFGKEITEYDYSNGETEFNLKNKLKIGTNLQKGRFLYYKYEVCVGSHSMVHNHDKLADSAKVMDFECEDTICTNAQACQTQVTKFLKFVLSGIAKRRVKEQQRDTTQVGESTVLLPEHIYDFCYKMGEMQILQCLEFIEQGQSWLESKPEFDKFDNVMFDVISGIFQTHKMINFHSNNIPGAYIRGVLETIINQKLFERVLKFGVEITQYVENLLASGKKIANFRLSYPKVMWKNISILIWSLHQGQFFNNEGDLNKFLIDFRTDPKDMELSSYQYRKFPVLKDKNKIKQQYISQAQVNLKNLIYKLNYSISSAFFKIEKIFEFMNRHCKSNCYPMLLSIYESLLKKFDNLAIFKKLALKKTSRHNPMQLDHMGDFGRNGRYELYMGQLGGQPHHMINQNILRRIQGIQARIDGNNIIGDPLFGEVEQRLIDMEFNRENVERAVALSGNNFDRALDILLAEQSNEEAQENAAPIASNQRDQNQQDPPAAAQEEYFKEWIDKIQIEDILPLDTEINELICLAYNQLTNTPLYNDFKLNSENVVSGQKIYLKEFFTSTQFLLKILFEGENTLNSALKDIFKKHYCHFPTDLDSLESMRNLVIKIFIFKQLNKGQYFDKYFFLQNADVDHLKSNNMIQELTKILKMATEKMQKFFHLIRNKETTNDDNELPLLQALVQMIQEILWDTMAMNCIEGNVLKVTRIGLTVKDAVWIDPKLKSEQSIKEKIDIITKYQIRLKEFLHQDGTSIQFEQILESQINLLKVYHNTPVSIYNQGCETMYPVTLAISLLTSIFKFSDIFQEFDVRKKFMQLDGLKHLFGVSIWDSSANPAELCKKAKPNAFLQENLNNGGLIQKFMETLANDKKNQKYSYVNSIKQLMFIQYKENCKRESKKDISEWYKPVFEGMQAKESVQSPKATPSLKKVGLIQSKKLFKNQSKQLKVLMEKNQSYNEVPLKQFLEFFIQSDCNAFISDPEAFIAACNYCCVIDVAEEASDDKVKVEKITTIRLKNSILKDLILNSKNENRQSQSTWQSEFKKNYSENELQFNNEIVQQLLDIFITQIKGYKMNILKNFKSNKLTGEEIKIEIKDNKLYAHTEEQFTEYLFNECQILQIIADIVTVNPAMVGSVLKHKDQKTFKYIIRNILAIKSLKITENNQVVFEEISDELDPKVMVFFKRMLLDTHTIQKCKKIYRLEARKVFVREITKNLMEYEPSEGFNSKLLQNYCALLTISQFLMVQDKKLEHSNHDQRVKAIQQSIRRYNTQQKQQMLNQILFETQMMNSRNQCKGLKINFFKQIYRIRDEIQQKSNMIIKYQPKALTQCVDIMLQIVNQYAKMNKEQWKQLQGQKKATQVPKEQRQSTMDHIVESESEEESRSKNEDDLGLIAAEDASLTMEDQQEIRELQEDRMSNIGLRTRSNNQVNLYPGLEYDQEEEGELEIIEDEGGEDDLLDDISDDSYAYQDLQDHSMQEFSDEDMEDEMEEGESSDGSDGGIDGQSDIIIQNIDDINNQSQDSENEEEMEDNENDRSNSQNDFEDEDDDGNSFGSYGEYGDEESNERSAAGEDQRSDMSFSQDPYYEEDDEEMSRSFSERNFQRVRNMPQLPPPISGEGNNLWPDQQNTLLQSNQISQELQNIEQQLMRRMAEVRGGEHRGSRTQSFSPRSRSYSQNSNSQSMQLNVAAPMRPNHRVQDGLVNYLEEMNKLLQTLANEQSQQIQQIQTRQAKKANEKDMSCNVLHQLESFDGQKMSQINKQKLYNLIFNCINSLVKVLNQKLKLDQNLYISNMIIINQENIMGYQTLQALDEFQRGTSLLEQQGISHEKTGENSINVNQRDLHPPNTSDIRPDKNDLVALGNLDGYNEFVKAMKILSGEQLASPTAKPQNEDDNQIREQHFDNAFDQIDPLFTEALNAHSIQIVKENDKLIRDISIKNNQINQVQIHTINDFLKKQTQELRQQLLKNLEPQIITYLSSDLYTEAKRVRQLANPQAQAPVGPSGQNAQRVRAAANARRGSQRALPNARPLPGAQNLAAAQDQDFPTRNRFLSIDSQTITIENIEGKKLNQRDSESEDIVIPQQKSNFHPNAFFFNIHTYMKENMESIKNMIIKTNLKGNGAYFVNKQGQIFDQIPPNSKKKNITTKSHQNGNQQQIYTNEDLDQFCEKLIFDQFNSQTQEGQNNQDSNISQISGVIDMAITEIICSKANMQNKKVSPGQLLQKLRVISQIPNFRIGLIVKIIQIMSNEIESLKTHIKTEKDLQKDQIIKHNMNIYPGVTKIWDFLTSDEPIVLSPKKCLSFFLSYLYELQQMVFESKQNKLDALEILKKPSQDPILQSLFSEFNMPNVDMTLLDQILQMILDYIELLCLHPDAFDFQESHEKDFNRWKQEILQNVCMILYQINVSLNILKRKELTPILIETYQKEYSLSNQTVNKIFKILFFIDQDDDKYADGKKNHSMFLDQDKKSIKMVSQVLSRISMLPLDIDKYTQSNIQNIPLPQPNLLDLQPQKEKQKSQNMIVPKKLSQIINNYMGSFSSFFDKQFQEFDKNSQSILSCSSKQQQKKLALIIEKILHVFKISINLTFVKNNICEDQYLKSCLQIVQKIIENEEQYEISQIGIIVDDKSTQKQTYLFKEEFKLIMQLIFTLSEYDLKNFDGPINEKRRSGEPVSIQSCDLMKATFKDQVPDQRMSSNATVDDALLLKMILCKFQGIDRIQDLIRFFFKNKGLINKFIRINQSSITEQFQGIVNKVPEILDFDSKRLLWRVLIKKTLRRNQPDGEYEIDIGVRRNQVFGDSFEQLKDISLASWKQKFTIEFHDEEGVDEGGLTKEWYQLISQGIFDPNYALFQQSSKGSTYYPNPNSVVHEKEEMIELFKFVGRIIGKALCEGQLLDCYFVKALYKMMLGQPLILSDLEDFDPQLYNSLVYMLENDADMLCQTFVLSNKFFDEDKDVELKENGKEIDVTNENKFEYVQLVLHYRLYSCIKTQVDSFLQGFHDLVPLNLIKIFDYRELELLISGLPTVDIQDLKEHVIYKNYNKQSKVIQWLWEVLEEFSNTDKAEFIQFVTGSSKVPVEGFKGLRGTNGIQKVEIIKLVCDKPDQRLPQAHTCFFQLDLPEYTNKDILRQKLYMAVKEGKTFNIA